MKTRLAVITAAAVLLAGCGDYYTATVQGYTVDQDSEAGIDGATVYIFSEDPVGVAAADYPTSSMAYTTTSTMNNRAGYFSLPFIWNNAVAKYWPDRDTASGWFIVTHPDYREARSLRYNILSDETNTVADILMARARFRGPDVLGTVTVNGLGENGVRVSLTYDGETEPAYWVTSQTIDGTAGRFRFREPEWSDLDADSVSTVTALVEVDDPDYSSVSREITLTSTDEEEAEHEITEAFAVTHADRTEFSTTARGRIYRILTDSQVGVQGISIRIEFAAFDEDGNPAPDRVITATTGTDGRYSIPLQWIDETPGGFDGENETGIGTDPEEVPEGEDGLLITVTYTDSSGADGFPGPSATAVIANYKIASFQDPWDLPEIEYAP